MFLSQRDIGIFSLLRCLFTWSCWRKTSFSMDPALLVLPRLAWKPHECMLLFEQRENSHFEIMRSLRGQLVQLVSSFLDCGSRMFRTRDFTWDPCVRWHSLQIQDQCVGNSCQGHQPSWVPWMSGLFDFPSGIFLVLDMMTPHFCILESTQGFTVGMYSPTLPMMTWNTLYCPSSLPRRKLWKLYVFIGNQFSQSWASSWQSHCWERQVRLQVKRKQKQTNRNRQASCSKMARQLGKKI